MSRDIAKPIVTARSFEELPHTLVSMEVAALCCVVNATVFTWVSSGKLSARKAGGIWLIEKSALLKFIEGRGMRLIFNNVERAF